MATYKLNFIFQSGSQGWSEVWYRVANTPQEATVLTQAQVTNFMRIRGDATLLRAVRASDTSRARRTYLRILNVYPRGPGRTTAQGTEPPGAALLGYVTCADFTRRPLLLRGLDDLEVERDAAGNPIWNAGITTAFNAYKSAVLGMRLGAMVLTYDDIANPPRIITQFAPGNASSSSTAVQYQGLAVPDGARVVFHQTNRNLFPGLQGTPRSATTGVGALSVNVGWRVAATTWPGNGASLRVATLQFKEVDDIQAEDIRTRKVGRPSILSRGRRSAIRYRSL